MIWEGYKSLPRPARERLKESFKPWLRPWPWDLYKERERKYAELKEMIGFWEWVQGEIPKREEYDV